MMSLEQYLTKDASLRPPVPTPTRWTPPQRSRASRRISMRSKGSSRGAFVANGFSIVYESKLEYWVGLACLARHDVADLLDQPPAVEYVDDDGVVRQHTFDYLVTFIDGTRVLVAVKPNSKVQSSGIDRIVELVAEQISPSVADHVVLITEAKLTADDRFNAELIHAVRRGTNSKDDVVIARLVGRLRNTTTVRSLVDASGLNGHGFGAVVRAIASGRLCLTEPCRIDYDAIVRSGKRKAR